MQMVDLEEKSRFFKALGDPIRLKIVHHLLKKDRCICICELAGLTKRDQSVVFRHIQILKDTGIVDTKKDACFLNCCLKDKDKIKKLLR